MSKEKIVHVISDDLELINALNEIKEMNVIKITIDQLNEIADILIVSNKKIDINKLLSLKDKNIKCFYLTNLDDSKTIEKTDKSLLEIKNIILVPPKRTVEQIRDFIISKIYNMENNNNVITLFGADSKVGTTSIAQNLAIYLANNLKDKKIIMLFLNGQDGLDYIEKSKDNGLSELKIKLKSNLLTISAIMDNCYKLTENLTLLRGESDQKETVYYTQNEINNLIDLCKDNFDIVIIDAGSVNNLYLRMTYSALINADNKILVIDQMPKTYDIFCKTKTNVLDPLDINNFKCIVNKFISDSIMQKKDKLIQQYQLPIISTIPLIDEYYHIAAENNIEQFMQDKGYKKNIQELAEYIAKKLGFSIKSAKKSILSFIKGW